MKRLAIVITHPIQYYSPFFKLLHKRGKVEFKVFYTWSQALKKVEDPDFGKSIVWDIPLLEGYKWEVVINVSKNPSSKTYKGIINPDLIDRLKFFSPSAILFFGWNHQSHLRSMIYFKGEVPVWFMGDSTLLDYPVQNIGGITSIGAIKSYLKFQIRTLFLKWIYQYVDKALYVGVENKKYFLHHSLREDQLIFSPHAVDNSRFQEKTSTSREELGISDSDIVLLFAGKFEPKKCPDHLIEAFYQLNKSNLHLLLVGDGYFERRLKKLAKDHPQIYFLPFQNQTLMPKIYQTCDIFCLPSQGPGETWGLAVNEAMACGKEILVSNKVGCANDLVRKGENGYVFNSKEDLKFKLNLLTLQNLKEMGNKSQEIIKDYSFKQKCENLELALNGSKL